MAQWTFINHEYLHQKDACLHVSDLSIQRGYGLFDYLKVIESSPIFIDEHIERFFRSAEAMHLTVPLSKEELKEIIHNLASRNQLPLSGVRMTLTGGYAADGYTISAPNLIITQNAFSLPTEEAIQKGLHLITATHQRQLAHVKTTDYIMAIWLQKELQSKGADDVLYTFNNEITECPRANIFIVDNKGSLITPGANILPGITRSKVLGFAKDYCTVEERTVNVDELKAAAAIFITSTTKGILPVRQVDDHHYNTNHPVTTQLIKQLNQLIDDAAKKFA